MPAHVPSDEWQAVERRTARVLDDERATTHLSRLGVNPVTIQRLRGYAEADEMRLREFVAYVLSTYEPASDLPDPDYA